MTNTGRDDVLRNTRNMDGVSWSGNGAAAVLLVLLSGVGFAMLAFRPVLAEEVRYLFMLWNLFLAWLPYVASASAVAIWRAGRRRPRERRHPLQAAAVAGLGVLWLLFYPNAAYLTTDFIHLIVNRSIYIVQGAFGYLVWYDIVLFFFFSWCGIFLGFLSQYQFHRLFAERFGEAAGWLFVAATCALGGYGVFLGRVVRLNSWDALLSPTYLAEEILGNLHWRGFGFSAIFGFFMLVTYAFLYVLQEKRGSYTDRRQHTM